MLVPGGDYSCVVMQNGATATGNGLVAPMLNNNDGGYTTLTVQVVGITTATITFEATVDGTNYVSALFKNISTGTEATTATADGIYFAVLPGVTDVRARISAYTSGTITVTGVSVA